MLKLTFFTTFFVLAVLTACSFATSSPPPACTLACINEEPTPSDYKAVCGSQDVQSCLASKCAGSEQAAINFFKSTCTAAGYQVGLDLTATQVNSSGSPSKSTSTTGSATASATGASSGGNASITSSGSTATGTGAQGQSGSGAVNNVASCGLLFLVLFVMGTMAL